MKRSPRVSGGCSHGRRRRRVPARRRRRPRRHLLAWRQRPRDLRVRAGRDARLREAAADDVDHRAARALEPGRPRRLAGQDGGHHRPGRHRHRGGPPGPRLRHPRRGPAPHGRAGTARRHRHRHLAAGAARTVRPRGGGRPRHRRHPPPARRRSFRCRQAGRPPRQRRPGLARRPRRPRRRPRQRPPGHGVARRRRPGAAAGGPPLSRTPEFASARTCRGARPTPCATPSTCSPTTCAATGPASPSRASSTPPPATEVLRDSSTDSQGTHRFGGHSPSHEIAFEVETVADRRHRRARPPRRRRRALPLHPRLLQPGARPAQPVHVANHDRRRTSTRPAVAPEASPSTAPGR